jgi:hypothetical protein
MDLARCNCKFHSMNFTIFSSDVILRVKIIHIVVNILVLYGLLLCPLFSSKFHVSMI